MDSMYLPRYLPHGEWSESAKIGYGLIEGDMPLLTDKDIVSMFMED